MGSNYYDLSSRSKFVDELERKEKEIMKPFEKCPVCSGELTKKKVEKLLRGGGNIASIEVFADVCLHCGERLYSQDVVQTFEQIRAKLAQEDTSEFIAVGKAYQVAQI